MPTIEFLGVVSHLLLHREFIGNFVNGDFIKVLLVDYERLDIMGKGDV